MLDSKIVSSAVDVQKRTYKLLGWIEAAVKKGFVSAKSAHNYATASDAVVQWIDEHFANIPPDCLPQSRNEEHVRPFANMLSTYLLTSFDFVEQPGRRVFSECGCFCPMCSYVAKGRHLRPKKLSSKDKKRARKLKLAYLQQLALDRDVSLSESQLEGIIDDNGLREAVAMATYGEQLVRRIAGHVEGPAVLALWRGFAWNASGSPKPGFKLKAKQIMNSQRQIVDWMIAGYP